MNKKEYDKLYKLFFKEFNDENQISSYEEFIAFIKEMKSIMQEVNKEMKAEKRTTELYALSSGLLALALESSKENIKEQLKNYSTVYETLFTNISNDCLAIIKLLESGFEFQARILTRNLFELVYTLLVVIVNKEKCKAYFNSARLENSYDVWNKYIRMSKLNEELYNFEKKTDSEYAEMMKESRKRIYSQYSSYAHNDFMYCFIGCHSTDQTNEMVNYNLWGNYNYNAKYILSSVNDLLWMMFLYFKSFMSQDNIFDKEDFITKDYYKYWNDALFISVILDEQKRKKQTKQTKIMMNKESDFMQNTETNRIENKEQLNEDFEQEVIAFLNYKEGGIIYVGINKNGQVVGVENTDLTQLQIKDRIKNNIQPSTLGLFDVTVETIDNKEVIRVIISSGTEKPYYLRKKGRTPEGCYVRVGSSKEQMTERMIDDMYA